MANYTENDVVAAAANGLISEADRDYLLEALQPQGSALGAAGGALAGAALGGAGGKLLGDAAGGLANKDPEWMQKVGKWAGSPMPAEAGLSKAMPGMLAGQSQGALAGGAGLGAMGAVGGGMAGSALAGGPELGGEEANALIAALMDPQTPKKDKAMIMEYLQMQGAGAPETESEGGMPWGGMAGGGLGALAGGALGGALGQKLMSKMAPSMGQAMPEGMGLGMGLNRGGAAGGGAGALIGGGAGALGGNAMFPASNYEDPLA